MIKITSTVRKTTDNKVWLNGYTNNGLVYIKTKRKSVLVIHEKCIQKEATK